MSHARKSNLSVWAVLYLKSLFILLLLSNCWVSDQWPLKILYRNRGDFRLQSEEKQVKANENSIQQLMQFSCLKPKLFFLLSTHTQKCTYTHCIRTNSLASYNKTHYSNICVDCAAVRATWNQNWPPLEVEPLCVTYRKKLGSEHSQHDLAGALIPDLRISNPIPCPSEPPLSSLMWLVTLISFIYQRFIDYFFLWQ